MNMSIQKKFGYCIRIFRQNLGLSQEKFSLKIGMDRTYYASVENGKRNLSIMSLEKITMALGCSMAEFFEIFE